MAVTPRKITLGVVVKGSSNIGKVLGGEISAIDRFTDSIDKALISLTSINARQFSGILVSLSAAFLTFLGGAAFSAGALEAQLRRVQVVTGEFVPDLAGLTAGLMDTSGATGLAVEQMAKLAEAAGTAGLAAQLGQEGLESFVDTVAKFSVVSGLAPEAAGKTFTELTKQLRLSGREIPIFASALQAVGKNSVSGTAQVANFVKSLVVLQKTSNFTNAQLLGIAGAVRTFGNVSQEVLRTNFDKFFTVAVKNADKFGAAMGLGTGPTAARAVRNFIDTNPFGFFIAFIKSMEGLAGSTSAVSAAFDDLGLGGSRIQQIFKGAIGQTDEILKLTKIAEDEYKSFGKTLDEDFATVMNALNKQLQRFFVNVKNLIKVIGLPFLKPLTLVLKALNGILVVLRKLGETKFGQALIFGTAVGATGLLAKNLAQLFSRSALAKTTLFGALMAGDFGPLKKMIMSAFSQFARLTGLGAVAAGLATLFAAVFGKSIKRAFMDVMLAVRSIFGLLFKNAIPVEDFIALGEKGLLNPVKFVVVAVRGLFRFVKGIFLGVFGVNTFDEFLGVLQTFVKRAQIAFDVLFDRFVGLVSFLSGASLDGLKALGLTPKGLEELGKALGSIPRRILTGEFEIFSKLTNVFEGFLNLILPPQVSKGITNFFRAIGNGMVSVANGLGALISKFGQFIDTLGKLKGVFGENVFRKLTEQSLGRFFGFDLTTQGGVDQPTGTTVQGTASEVGQGGVIARSTKAALELLKAGLVRSPTVFQEATGAPLPTQFGAVLVMDPGQLEALAKGQATAVNNLGSRLGEVRGFRTPGRTVFGGPRPFAPNEFTGGGDQ